MVSTNNLKIETAKKFSGESATVVAAMNFGTGTTAPSRSDSSLSAETGAIAIDSYYSGANQNVGTFVSDITNIDTSLHTTLTEIGLSTSLSAGTQYSRHVHGGFTPSAAKTCRIVHFLAVNPASNDERNMVTEHAVQGVVNWVTGDASFIDVATYVAWGAELILDKMDSLGTGANQWLKSTDAASAVLDSVNYIEGTASLQLGKTGTSSATFYNDRTLSAAIDASSATSFRARLRLEDSETRDLLDSATALQLLFGNDASNYRLYSFSAENLDIGWIKFDIPISDMTQTGTCLLSAIDYARLTWKTSSSGATVATGNLMADYLSFWWPLDSEDSSLHQEITRTAVNPAATRRNEQITYSSSVPKATGNTYQYNYFGLFDASSNGNPTILCEISDLQKNSLVLITNETTLTITIKDY